MNKIFRYGLQIFNYLIFIMVVWYFSIKPPYHQLEDDQAVIVLSFTHATKIREACHKLSQEELMKLAPNMRLPTNCPRERSPLNLELYLDGMQKKKGIIPAGVKERWEAAEYIQLKIGNAGGLKAKINGKPYSFGLLGEVANKVVTWKKSLNKPNTYHIVVKDW